MPAAPVILYGDVREIALGAIEKPHAALRIVPNSRPLIEAHAGVLVDLHTVAPIVANLRHQACALCALEAHEGIP